MYKTYGVGIYINDNHLARITSIFNFIYGLMVALFLADTLTGFDIKSQELKSMIYLGVLCVSPVAFIWNTFLAKSGSRKIIWTIISALFLALIMIVGPMKFWFSSGSWKTQTILYRNAHIGFRTIESQMQDVGALGYNDRTVEVIYLTPLFIITCKAPDDIDKKPEWVRVNEDVNELELKFP